MSLCVSTVGRCGSKHAPLVFLASNRTAGIVDRVTAKTVVEVRQCPKCKVKIEVLFDGSMREAQ